MKERFEQLAEEGGGYFTSKQAEASGINRMTLKKCHDQGIITRIERGRYTLPDEWVDEYALLQSYYAQAIYSHGTALFLWGMSDRIPAVLDVSVPQGTNVYAMKKKYPDIRCHYISKKLHGLGRTETVSPQGGRVILYDRERCICDIVRARQDTDMQIYTQAIKEYFANKPDAPKLLKYAKQLNIEKQIRIYTEVMA